MGFFSKLFGGGNAEQSMESGMNGMPEMASEPTVADNPIEGDAVATPEGTADLSEQSEIPNEDMSTEMEAPEEVVSEETTEDTEEEKLPEEESTIEIDEEEGEA